ncbi:MAG TPA: trypsin-like peptidase domain-containing protein [Gemmatimonadaceae bacterium]|nr:trypsin-like peptidase domain-containing protein [Gemmatimonadaceae bacterium]
MTLELRVLAGARRGTVVRSDRPVVALGRHGACELQLDPEADLDVSARHAEIHVVRGTYLVRDAGSTNGTLVNGVRVAGDRALRDGDVIGLGPNGPTVQVRVIGTAPSSARRGVLVASALLLAGIMIPLAMVWKSRQARAVPTAVPVQAGSAAAATTAASNDFRAAFAASGPAVAYVVAELEGRSYGGTAFNVAPEGRLVTNRHLVVRGTARATRVMVQFANSSTWHAARLERTATDPADDLALLELASPSATPLPVIVGIDTVPPEPGTPVASIGFPLADGMPMDSVEHRTIARASLVAGVVSRSLVRLLQIDSYATHGSSGSPVVDRDGRVLGVVYGGPSETNGRIVWAVPGRKVVELVRGK